MKEKLIELQNACRVLSATLNEAMSDLVELERKVAETICECEEE